MTLDKKLLQSINQILAVSWRGIWSQEERELRRIFNEFGDRAYGAWIVKFMAPVFERLTEEGYQVNGGFNLRDSMENWGPPEERERCAWYVVKDQEGLPISTLVLQVYHSHAAFHIPRAPRLFALEVTKRSDIIRALSHASNRVRWDLPAERLPAAPSTGAHAIRWEYATDVSVGDCLAPNDEGLLSNWLVDEQLGHWGRHGWELINAVPTEGKIIAFFKRPVLEQ
ncbi:DUF6022 family protein [Cohnella sp. JJ-181]|uniref:DUF6022 family protein n=1 Tax=Cohnella rhizoplanae TaxID=2974897 RepID=UPI0022FFA764|nr:DUF6022 family protein [Cohnella sp. JJ-181]CAI6083083.1 hypothetical protein COHCIP112018_03867 [Cohnella sp. JJ-181]